MATRRTFLVDTLRLAGGLVIASCAPSPTGGPGASPSAAVATGPGKRGGQLVFADIADPKSLDPALITDRTGARTQQAIYDPLIDRAAFIEPPTALQKYSADYGVPPVGTGPFKFVEYVKDDHTLVERNAEYWDQGRPYLDSLKFRPILTDATRLVELRSGGAHIMVDPPFQDIERLKQMSDVKL